jgi:hypothetical protein
VSPLPFAAGLGVLVLASAAVPAQGAPAQGRWVQIGTTVVGNPVYLDPKSVSKAGGIVTATVRAVFVKPVKTPRGALNSSRTVAMFDCAKQTVAVKDNIYYFDERTNRIYERSTPKLPGYAPAIKGSLPDVALGYLCKR